MTITENQRRTLDLMAERIGRSWADVEQLSDILFGECVAGLSWEQADKLMRVMPASGEMGDADGA